MTPFYILGLTHPQNYSSRCTFSLTFQPNWTSCITWTLPSNPWPPYFYIKSWKYSLKHLPLSVFFFFGACGISVPQIRGMTVKALDPNHETTRGLPGILLLFSCPVVSNSLWPHGLQHARLPCPLSSPGGCPSSCPLHWWCHPANSSSDALFSFCPPSFPASETFPMSRLHQMIKILELQLQHSPSSEYSGFISLKIDWIDWCDLLAVQGTLESLLQYHSLKTSTLGHSIFFTVQLSQTYVITGETIALTICTFVSKVMSAFQNTV